MTLKAKGKKTFEQAYKEEQGASRAVVLPGGSTRSEVAVGYHMVPPALLRRVAKRFTFGALKHNEDNWKLSLGSPADARIFLREAYNHAVEHLLKMMEEERPSDDHLGAIGWWVAAVAFAEQKFGCDWRRI